MTEKLLKIAGVTLDQKAKGFSVDKDGRLNVVGPIEGATIGEVTEPYSDNYTGLVAVLGKKVFTATQAPGLRGSWSHILGRRGNYYYILVGVSNTVRIQVLNLNLQFLREVNLPQADYKARNNAVQDKLTFLSGKYLVMTYESNIDEGVLRTVVYDVDNQFEEVYVVDGSIARCSIAVARDTFYAVIPSGQPNAGNIAMFNMVTEVSDILDFGADIATEFGGGQTYRARVVANSSYLVVNTYNYEGNTVEPHYYVYDLNDLTNGWLYKQKLSAFTRKNSAGVVGPSTSFDNGYLSEDNTLTFVGYRSPRLTTAKVTPTKMEIGSFLDVGFKSSATDIHKMFMFNGNSISINDFYSFDTDPIVSDGRAISKALPDAIKNSSIYKDDLGRLITLRGDGELLALSTELELKGYKVV